MAVQAKEPISETESNGALRGPRRAAVPFVAPDVDVVLKPLTQKSRPYPQSNQHPVFLHRFPSKVSEVFHPLQTISALQIGFPHR